MKFLAWWTLLISIWYCIVYILGIVTEDDLGVNIIGLLLCAPITAFAGLYIGKKNKPDA